MRDYSFCCRAWLRDVEYSGSPPMPMCRRVPQSAKTCWLWTWAAALAALKWHFARALRALLGARQNEVMDIKAAERNLL